MKPRSALGGVAGALAMGLWASAAMAATPTPLNEAGAPTESLKLAQDPTSRLTLAVMINGQGPFDFLVDTGSERTVISRELATKLALPDGPTVTVQQSMGADDVKTAVIDRLAIGGRTINHIEAPALAAKDLGGAGILGVDALNDLHLVMDFKTMRMSSAPSRAEKADGETIVVHGRSRFGELVLTDSKIRGVRILVVLDSGSQLSVGNLALRKLLTGHADGGDASRVTTQIVGVTGRSQTVELDDVAEADVGGIVIRNMPLAFAPLRIFNHIGLVHTPALLLGMDVLSQCKRVSVDLRRHEATFTLN